MAAPGWANPRSLPADRSVGARLVKFSSNKIITNFTPPSLLLSRRLPLLVCGGLHRTEPGKVAGVNVTLDLITSASFACAGMLAPDGRCKTLDTSADGYVRGEAVAAIVLRAVPDDVGDSARGPGRADVVLLGSAVNQDGRSSSLTAPNGPAQQAVVRAALLGGSLAPGAVGNLHLHGTGTALGDPIEVGR